MPFKSAAQRRWMYSQHPKMAKKWAAHTPKGKELPDRVSDALSPYREAGCRTDEEVLAFAAMHGPVALAEAQAALEEEGGRQNSTAMVVVPADAPGRNVCDFIRRLTASHSKLIIAAQSGRLAPGNYERLLRASMPDCEKKLRVMDVGSSLADAVNAAERNRHYRPSQALQVFCNQEQARGFAQEIRDGSLKFDPTVITVTPQKIPTDDVRAIEKAVELEDEDAMHRVLDPHIFSSQEGLADYKQALMHESVSRDALIEFLKDIAPSRKEAVTMLVDIVSENWKLLQKRGIDPEGMQYLGAGNNGAAWKLHDNRVLKVTTDDAEAHVASHLKGKKFKHVFTIHDVWAFPGLFSGHHVYGLVTEGGLEKPDEAECSEFDWVTAKLEEYEELLEDNFKQALQKMMADSIPNGTKKQILTLVKKFDLAGMMADMKRIGVQADLHSGNFMRRKDGTFVIIDIGTGGDQENSKPPFLESVGNVSLPPAKPWPDPDMFVGVKGTPKHDKHGFERYRFADVPHEVIVPVGLRLFHGTSSGADFSVPRGPASFALDSRTAQGYADNEGEGLHPRVMKFAMARPARCLDHPGTGPDSEKASFWLSRWADEKLGRGFTKDWGLIGYSRVPDKLAIVRQAGYDGIVVRRLDDGGAEVCLFEPEGFVKPIAESIGDIEVPSLDDGRLDELYGTGYPGSGVNGPPTMRGSNSSAWSGGMGALKEPERHVPEDENETEHDIAMDWGPGRASGASF